MERLTTRDAVRDVLAEHFVMWHELPAPMRGEWRCACGKKFGFSDSAIDHQAEALGAVTIDAATLAHEGLPYEPCAPRYGSCALPPGHDGPHHGYPQSVRLIFRALAVDLAERGERP